MNETERHTDVGKKCDYRDKKQSPTDGGNASCFILLTVDPILEPQKPQLENIS